MRSAFLLLCLAFSACQRPHLDYGPGVTTKPWLKTATTADGSPITYPTGPGEVTLAEVIIAPGAETGWHLHPIPLFAFVLEGKLDVEMEGGKTFTYSAGQGIAELVNLRHNGSNHGKTPVRLLVAYCGVKGEPMSVKTPGTR
jgi:quercetin dioxygenase-like cupin family protein